MWYRQMMRVKYYIDIGDSWAFGSRYEWTNRFNHCIECNNKLFYKLEFVPGDWIS